jgi:hypothetical protein
MNSSGELTLADLAKKIDEQSRFTRSVSIICTLAILGVMFYTLTEMFSNLPSAIILHYMANLDKIVHEWNSIQATVSRHHAPAPAESTPPAESKKSAP